MQQQRSIYIITILCLISAPEAFGADISPKLLSTVLGGARSAGFVGLKDEVVPGPPAIPVALPVGNPQDSSIQKMLNDYARQILAFPKIPSKGFPGPDALKLGFSPTQESPWNTRNNTMPIKFFGLENSSTGEGRYFNATTVRGPTEIILAYGSKQLLRAYLISPNGELKRAIIDDGKLIQVIPIDQAKDGCQAEINFWMDQYAEMPKLEQAQEE